MEVVRGTSEYPRVCDQCNKEHTLAILFNMEAEVGIVCLACLTKAATLLSDATVQSWIDEWDRA